MYYSAITDNTDIPYVNTGLDLVKIVKARQQAPLVLSVGKGF